LSIWFSEKFLTDFFQYGMYKNSGGMSEWLKEAVLKTVVLKGTVGSNPTPSARRFNVLNLINGLSPIAHGKEVFHHTLMLEAKA
jgi:hypothetical protein